MKEKDPDNAKGKCVIFLKPASGVVKESIEMGFHHQVTAQVMIHSKLKEKLTLQQKKQKEGKKTKKQSFFLL